MDTTDPRTVQRALASTGLIAEIARPGSKGLEGPYRARLGAAQLWPRLSAFIARQAPLDDTVATCTAATLMYLAAETSAPSLEGQPAQVNWLTGLAGRAATAFDFTVIVHLGAAREYEALMYNAATVWCLSRSPELRVPVGASGAVITLVENIRRCRPCASPKLGPGPFQHLRSPRWYESDPNLRQQSVQVANWALAALCSLCQERENLDLFAGVYKPKHTAAPSFTKSGFGYSLKPSFDSCRKVDLANEGAVVLHRATAWGAFGWGNGTQAPEAPPPDAINATSNRLNRKVQEQLKRMKERQAAHDPIGLLVQLNALKLRQKSLLVKVKLLSVRLMRHLAQV